MKRLFWTTLLITITLSGGWGLYVSAQELQRQIEPVVNEFPAPQRYQFTEHFFAQRGQTFEIFLRMDRFTGQTWRFHASQPGWALVNEGAENGPESGNEDRYELMSHIYRSASGVETELILRVDFQSGRSWKYEGNATAWEELNVEAASQPRSSAPSGPQVSIEAPEDDEDPEAPEDEDAEAPSVEAGK